MRARPPRSRRSHRRFRTLRQPRPGTVGGCGCWRSPRLSLLAYHFIPRGGKAQAAAAKGGKGQQQAPRAVPVLAVAAKNKDVGVYLTGLGSVNPLATVAVRSRVDGQLVSLDFHEGQLVRAGDLLAEIDPRPFQVQLMQAQGQRSKDEAVLQNARVDLQRYQVLAQQDSIARQQLDTQAATVRQAEATLQSDQAQIESAKLNLTYSRITAPIGGRVGLRHGRRRQHRARRPTPTASSSSPSCSRSTSSSPSPPTSSRRCCRRCTPAGSSPSTPTTATSSRSSARGTLLAVDNQIDPATGTVRLKAIFPNAGRALFPNQFVNARLLVNTLRGAVVVPTAADPAQPAVDASSTSSSRTRRSRSRNVAGPAHRGRRHGDPASGLAAGDVVVIDGVDKLRPGMKVDGQPRRHGRPPRGAGAEATAPQRTALMSPSRPFILRPIATSLLMAGLLLAGIVAFRQLPVSALPEVDYPTIQVITFYPGASPDVMASAVTAPLERQFGQVPGLEPDDLDQLRGQLGHHPAVRPRPRTSTSPSRRCRRRSTPPAPILPRDLPNPPIYSKTNPADAPVLTLALTSKTLPLSKVEDLADTRLAQKISQLPGVGLVAISGGQKPAVRIQANPTALSSYGLTLEDVRTAVAAVERQPGQGELRRQPRSPTPSAPTTSCCPSDQYRPLIIAYRNGAPVRLSDVANVIDDAENVKQAAWMNDDAGGDRQHPAPAGREHHQRRRPRHRRCCRSCAPRCRRRSQVAVLTDRTTTIRASVHDVEFELMLTIALVVMVIFLFLRTLAATIIPSVAVPLSLVGTFGAMYLLGYSLNNLTLMALTISTGFVVDDAIVMIENISRYIEEGEKPLEAALKGVGADRLHHPLADRVAHRRADPAALHGRRRRPPVPRVRGHALSVTILISAVVSLTLTPMMCRQAPAPQGRSRSRGASTAPRSGSSSAIIEFYGRTLAWVLEHQPLTLLVAVGTLVATILLYLVIPKGFFPMQDTGVILGISEAAQSVSFPAMAERQQALAQVILADPAVESLSSFIGVDGTNTTVNTGRIQINLKPLGDRDAQRHATSSAACSPKLGARSTASRSTCSRCRTSRSRTG